MAYKAVKPIFYPFPIAIIFLLQSFPTTVNNGGLKPYTMVETKTQASTLVLSKIFHLLKDFIFKQYGKVK